MKRGNPQSFIVFVLSMSVAGQPAFASPNDHSSFRATISIPDEFSEQALADAVLLGPLQSLQPELGAREKGQAAALLWGDGSGERLPVSLQDLKDDARELTILRHFLRELKQEQVQPGSGNIPRIAVIADEHGTMDKFDVLILDAINQVLPAEKRIKGPLDPDKPLTDQLALHGIRFPEDLRGKIYFHNLGDFMDRGPSGVKVFRRSLELINAGLSDFVIGNHDFWEFMNLQGFHLPSYDGFNFYGYSDDYDFAKGKIDDVVRRHHSDTPQTTQRSWWAEKLAEFTAHHAQKQREIWSRYDEIVNGALTPINKRGPGLFARVSPSLQPGSSERRLWDKFRGWYLVDVYTGTRAAGTVSVRWWQDLLGEFKVAYQTIEKQRGFDSELLPNQAWAEAIRLMEQEIIPTLRADLEEHLHRGEWWWRAFEAINWQNYSSPEWWSKDWVYHEGWGTSVLKEINALGGAVRVTPSNYLDNETLKRIADFYRDHFTLYVRDIYQNTYMHAFLPVKQDTGEFYFRYKGQDYVGNGGDGIPSVWEGLDRVTADIRNRGNSMSDLYEALSLVNEWYADNTTQAKWPHIASAINKFGTERLARVNGINRLFTGHLPFHEVSKLNEGIGIIRGFQVEGRFIFVDLGMGSKFGGRGAWVSVHADGLSLRGFEKEGDSEIIAHPRTVKTVPGVEGLTDQVLAINEGIPRDKFLPQVIAEVEKRIIDLETALGVAHEDIGLARESAAHPNRISKPVASAA